MHEVLQARIERQRELGRQHYARMRSDPEKRAKHAAYMREYMKDPAHRERKNLLQRERSSKQYLVEREKYVGLGGYKHKARIKKAYGLTVQQYSDLLTACESKCQVCGKPFDPKSKEPQIDHCHETGTVRGLLCASCNFAEGKLRTSERALKLYEYMKRNELLRQGTN